MWFNIALYPGVIKIVLKSKFTIHLDRVYALDVTTGEAVDGLILEDLFSLEERTEDLDEIEVVEDGSLARDLA